jgi:hypothetical protein
MSPELPAGYFRRSKSPYAPNQKMKKTWELNIKMGKNV